MNSGVKCEERLELVEIYNSLSAPLRKQLLTLARVIGTSKDLTLGQGKDENVKNKKPIG